MGIETVAAAFTDHLAVVLRLTLDAPILRRGRGTWKLNSAPITENHIMEDLRQKWTQRKRKHLYPDINTWWSRYCKKRIWVIFQYAEEERRRDQRSMENFYYECLYDIRSKRIITKRTSQALNYIKVKTVKLHSTMLRTSFLDTKEANQIAGEQPTLFHFIQMQKRRTARTVWCVRDDNGLTQKSPKGTAVVFTTFLRGKNMKILKSTPKA